MTISRRIERIEEILRVEHEAFMRSYHTWLITNATQEEDAALMRMIFTSREVKTELELRCDTPELKAWFQEIGEPRSGDEELLAALERRIPTEMKERVVIASKFLERTRSRIKK